MKLFELCNDIYIPKKGDQNDAILADYINRRQAKTGKNLKIMFLRESENVYRFGSKRVFVKVEKGGTIKIRIGGGFMHVDEFIEKYTQVELEKIQRNSMIERIADKIDFSKIANTMGGSKFSSSPEHKK
jgi:hypothetical protein